MRHKAVTIREVAQRAQVSVSTVSQILNGNPHYVGADKRERVLQAVEALQYRPNAIARSMVKQRTGTVGMIFTSVADNLFLGIVESVEATLSPEGYSILLTNTRDIESEIQAVESLQARQVDGFIFMSTTSVSEAAHLLRLKDAGTPLVVINRHLEVGCDVNQIQFNDKEAGYLASRHLLSLGHTSIAMIGGPCPGNIPYWHSAADRQEGWERALAEQGVAVPSHWLFDGKYTFEGGYTATMQLLKQARLEGKRPTALFVANDKMAIGALRALHYAGIRVPQEIALINIGDMLYSPHMAPALTTLAHPVTEAGKIAANLLLTQAASNEPLPVQRLMLSFELRIRESCGSNSEPSRPFL